MTTPLSGVNYSLKRAIIACGDWFYNKLAGVYIQG
jgi:hypothetical protein